MTFFTSYSSRSIGGGLGEASTTVGRVGGRVVASWSKWLSSSASVGRKAGGAAGDVDRDGEADPDEHVLLGWVHERGHDADDPAIAVEQRPAGVPGVDGGIDLDQALVDRAALDGLVR